MSNRVSCEGHKFTFDIFDVPSLILFLNLFAFVDFLKGVTYTETADPLLKQIYQKEGASPKAEKRKSVDPRQELFAAIQNRREE